MSTYYSEPTLTSIATLRATPAKLRLDACLSGSSRGRNSKNPRSDLQSTVWSKLETRASPTVQRWRMENGEWRMKRKKEPDRTARTRSTSRVKWRCVFDVILVLVWLLLMDRHWITTINESTVIDLNLISNHHEDRRPSIRHPSARGAPRRLSAKSIPIDSSSSSCCCFLR